MYDILDLAKWMLEDSATRVGERARKKRRKGKVEDLDDGYDAENAKRTSNLLTKMRFFTRQLEFVKKTQNKRVSIEL